MTIRCAGIVSSSFLASSLWTGHAAGQTCAVQDITKAPSSTIASNENFTKLVACLNELQTKLDRTTAKLETVQADLELMTRALPGAVVAFHRSSKTERPCPAGWSFFSPAAGRFILGAGVELAPDNKDENGNPLTVRPSFKEDATVKKSHGGEEKHLLTEAEMPEHRHLVLSPVPHDHFERHGSYSGGNAPLANVLTGPEGKGQPHPIMPPFVALYYCIKD